MPFSGRFSSGELRARLRQAELAYQEACEVVEQAREQRDDLVRQAVQQGFTDAEIAQAICAAPGGGGTAP